MERIVIVGTSGAGKSTLAKQLAARLNYPHIELDSLHWGPNWSEAPDFAEKVDAVCLYSPNLSAAAAKISRANAKQ